jgi:hypothetical protein
VVTELQASIEATPSSLEGLKALDSSVAQTRNDLGAVLTEQDWTALDAVASKQREAIETTLLNAELAKLDAAPQTLQGLSTVSAIDAGPVHPALSARNASTLEKAGAKRRSKSTRPSFAH